MGFAGQVIMGRPGRPDAYDSPENAPEAIAYPKPMSPAGEFWSRHDAVEL